MAILSTAEFTTPHKTIRCSLNIKTQELVNLKCVIYVQLIPLSLKCSDQLDQGRNRLQKAQTQKYTVINF